MNIQFRPTAAIKPYDHNPRINDAAIDAVARSIKAFGWRQPIVTDLEGVIIVGHTRWLAAQRLELTEVPVHMADLEPADARAYRIADNQTASLSEWNPELLQAEIGDLEAMAFDLDLLGFDGDELEQLARPPIDSESDDGAVPDLPHEPESSPGEVYKLGPHRLMVGDATTEADVRKLMSGDYANLLVSDPPYGVVYTGKTKSAMSIENDDMDDESFCTFLVKALKAADGVMVPGAGFYIWHSDVRGLVFRQACKTVGWPLRQCLIWAKNTMVLGRQDYQWRHEPCLYGWKPGAAHSWLADRKQTTVLTFDRPARNADHPTMKPVALIEYLIRNSARRNETVLDPFAGSGSTLIAAERSGRRARLMEIDPRYADVIRQRWRNYTNSE